MTEFATPSLTFWARMRSKRFGRGCKSRPDPGLDFVPTLGVFGAGLDDLADFHPAYKPNEA